MQSWLSATTRLYTCNTTRALREIALHALRFLERPSLAVVPAGLWWTALSAPGLMRSVRRGSADMRRHGNASVSTLRSRSPTVVKGNQEASVRLVSVFCFGSPPFPNPPSHWNITDSLSAEEYYARQSLDISILSPVRGRWGRGERQKATVEEIKLSFLKEIC